MNITDKLKSDIMLLREEISSLKGEMETLKKIINKNNSMLDNTSKLSHEMIEIFKNYISKQKKIDNKQTGGKVEVDGKYDWVEDSIEFD